MSDNDQNITVPSPDLDTIGKGSDQCMGLNVVKTLTQDEVMSNGKTNVPEVPY